MPDLITLAEAKEWLEITDSARDTLIASLVSAASEACLDILGRTSLLQATRTEVLSGGGGPTLPVNGWPIRSLTSVAIDGLGVVPVTQFTFDDHMVIWKLGKFPRGLKNVTVVFSGGEDAVPPAVKLATQYTAKAMWDAKKIDMNATSESWVGVGGAGFWPTGPGSVPPQAVSLLQGSSSRIWAS